jgi:hypothetical protein
MSTTTWHAIGAANDARFGEGKWHCDDIADDEAAPLCVLNYLAVARAPAWQQGKRPPLFATRDGKRVRVVMASRFGDVGITENLSAEHGYGDRVYLPELTDFADHA